MLRDQWLHPVQLVSLSSDSNVLECNSISWCLLFLNTLFWKTDESELMPYTSVLMDIKLQLIWWGKDVYNYDTATFCVLVSPYEIVWQFVANPLVLVETCSASLLRLTSCFTLCE